MVRSRRRIVKPVFALAVILIFIAKTADAVVDASKYYTFGPTTIQSGLVCSSFNVVAPKLVDVHTCDAACGALAAVCTSVSVSGSKKNLRCEDTIPVPNTSCRCCKGAP